MYEKNRVCCRSYVVIVADRPACALLCSFDLFVAVVAVVVVVVCIAAIWPLLSKGTLDRSAALARSSFCRLLYVVSAQLVRSLYRARTATH